MQASRQVEELYEAARSLMVTKNEKSKVSSEKGYEGKFRYPPVV